MHSSLPSCFKRPVSSAVSEFIGWAFDSWALAFPVADIGIGISKLLMWAAPRLHGAALFNSVSPTRSKAFLQYVCDRCLSAREQQSAVVCDLGGTGQVSVAMDRHGRVRQAADINRDLRVPAGYRSILDVPPATADLMLSSGMLEYNSDEEAISLLRTARAALAPGAQIVICEIEKSVFPRYNAYLLRRSSRVLSRTFGFDVILRPADHVVALLRAAGYVEIEVLRQRFIAPIGLGRAYVVFAR